MPFPSSHPCAKIYREWGGEGLFSQQLQAGDGMGRAKRQKRGQGVRSAPSQTYQVLCPHWPGQQPLAICFTELGKQPRSLSPSPLAAHLCVSWERQPPGQGSQGEGARLLGEGAPGSSQEPQNWMLSGGHTAVISACLASHICSKSEVSAHLGSQVSEAGCTRTQHVHFLIFAHLSTYLDTCAVCHTHPHVSTGPYA